MTDEFSKAVLDSLATHIAVLKHLLEEERRRSDQLQQLARAAVSLNARATAGELLQLVADVARDATDCHYARATLAAGGRDPGSGVSASGERPPWLLAPAAAAALYEALSAQSGPSRLAGDALGARPEYAAAAGAGAPPPNGWVAAGLVFHDGRVVGLLEVVDRKNGDFSADDEAIVVQLARMVSVALENAELLRLTEQSRNEAEAANQAKDEFLRVLSHEMRSPLNSIRTWAALLKTGKLDEEKTAKAIQSIERGSMAQSKLIDELLEVSRIVSGKLTLEMQAVDLESVVHTVIDEIRPEAEAKKLTLRRSIEPIDGTVRGDATRLEQVLVNLIANAIKFTPEGGTITVGLRAEEDAAVISVQDNGEGIPPEVAPLIFQRFRQADSSSVRRHGGLGLGLAIVESLVTRHGGRIEVTSAGAGRGSTFTVRLPIVTEATEQQTVLVPSATHAHIDLHGARILVVDDEREAREAIVTALEQLGAQVWSAGSADEAWTILDRESPTALVSDLAMPDRDGFSLLRRVRSSGRTFPAIALTGFASVEDARRAREAGFQLHVAKPVDPLDLAAAIAELG